MLVDEKRFMALYNIYCQMAPFDANSNVEKTLLAKRLSDVKSVDEFIKENHWIAMVAFSKKENFFDDTYFADFIKSFETNFADCFMIAQAAEYHPSVLAKQFEQLKDYFIVKKSKRIVDFFEKYLNFLNALALDCANFLSDNVTKFFKREEFFEKDDLSTFFRNLHFYACTPELTPESIESLRGLDPLDRVTINELPPVDSEFEVPPSLEASSESEETRQPPINKNNFFRLYQFYLDTFPLKSQDETNASMVALWDIQSLDDFTAQFSNLFSEVRLDQGAYEAFIENFQKEFERLHKPGVYTKTCAQIKDYLKDNPIQNVEIFSNLYNRFLQAFAINDPAQVACLLSLAKDISPEALYPFFQTLNSYVHGSAVKKTRLPEDVKDIHTKVGKLWRGSE